MYALVHDWTLTRSRIKGCRHKRNPFVIALTSALIEAFRKNISECWYIHFDGLGILTNYSFFAAHKNQEFVIKLKHKITPKRRGKHREKSEKAKTSSKKISSDFWRRCVETKASRIFRLQSGYSVYKHIDVSYMTVWSFREKSGTEPFSFNQRW